MDARVPCPFLALFFLLMFCMRMGVAITSVGNHTEKGHTGWPLYAQAHADYTVSPDHQL